MSMLQNIYREKLLNSVLFFAKNVKYPSREKIFKLLFILDFYHFKKIGRPVTNLDYYAWVFGPAPQEFWIELKSGIPEDFDNAFKIKYSDDIEGFCFIPLQQPKKSIFTPREFKIMDDLIFVFKNVTPGQVSESNYLKNSPWEKTKNEKGIGAKIDYELAIDADSLLSLEEAKDLLIERKEFFNNYPIQRKPNLFSL